VGTVRLPLPDVEVLEHTPLDRVKPEAHCTAEAVFATPVVVPELFPAAPP
jgi:hypothetical protein